MIIKKKTEKFKLKWHGLFLDLMFNSVQNGKREN